MTTMNTTTRERQTLAEWLGLPAEFTATRFMATIEITGGSIPRNASVGIPIPYASQSVEWWKEQAAQAIKGQL